jgi:threonine/homoserine/homoserine lactone efflux protein
VVHALIREPLAFAVFVVVSSVTPGPNNLMLLNVGVVRGRASAVRSSLGVSVGWAFQVLVFGLGVESAVRALPGLSNAIDVAGLCYLVWLAVKLLRAHQLGTATPMHGFAGAIRYQWVNPKAISMSLTTAGLFVVTGTHVQVASAVAVASTAFVLNVPCVLSWGLGGAALSTRLVDEREVVRFNRVAAATLLVMVAWLAVERTVY